MANGDIKANGDIEFNGPWSAAPERAENRVRPTVLSGWSCPRCGGKLPATCGAGESPGFFRWGHESYGVVLSAILGWVIVGLLVWRLW